MPYAIEYIGSKTGDIKVGPLLMKKIERPLQSVKKRPMTKAEAQEFCDRVNADPTYNNKAHCVVKISRKFNREIFVEKFLSRNFCREIFNRKTIIEFKEKNKS